MPSSQVMSKFKSGQLHSGGPGGPVVKNRKQAVAIMLSEKRNEDETGSPDLAGRQVASTREMARLAKQSGFNMVASNLTNLAERRETTADSTEAKIKRTRPVRRSNGR